MWILIPGARILDTSEYLTIWISWQSYLKSILWAWYSDAIWIPNHSQTELVLTIWISNMFSIRTSTVFIWFDVKQKRLPLATFIKLQYATNLEMFVAGKIMYIDSTHQFIDLVSCQFNFLMQTELKLDSLGLFLLLLMLLLPTVKVPSSLKNLLAT